MTDMLEMIARRAELLLAERVPVLVAIDGCCGSGKTTLAAALAERLTAEVLHMDDFYLRPEQRSPARYRTPGENVDHERFLAEVLLPLRKGEPALLRRFDCRSFTLQPPVEIPPAEIYLIEGSYSLHRELRELYDLRVFLTVDPDEQLRRITKRNGPEKAEEFRTRWIPLENLYFADLPVPELCDFVFKT